MNPLNPKNIIGTALMGVLVAAILFVMLAVTVLMSTVYVWQSTFSRIAELFTSFGISLSLIFVTTPIIWIICCWAFCLWRTIKKKRESTRIFVIFCIVCYALPNIFAAGILDSILSGAALAAIPAFVLYTIECRLLYGYGPLRGIAFILCKGNTVIRLIFAALGVLSILLGLLFLTMISLAPIVAQFCVSFLLVGALFFYTCIFGKNPPVSKFVNTAVENENS